MIGLMVGLIPYRRAGTVINFREALMSIEVQDKQMIAGIADGNGDALCQLDLNVTVFGTYRLILLKRRRQQRQTVVVFCDRSPDALDPVPTYQNHPDRNLSKRHKVVVAAFCIGIVPGLSIAAEMPRIAPVAVSSRPAAWVQSSWPGSSCTQVYRAAYVGDTVCSPPA